MSVPRDHVAVLGAGVCGLAAAWELLRSGAAQRVTVLEAEDRPGGMARSVHDPSGLQADLGPHRIHTEIEEIDALLGELCDREMHWVERRSAMWVEGQWVNYPFRLGGVLRLFGPIEFCRMGFSALWAKTSGLWRPRPANFEEHMRRAFGARVWNRVLRPYSTKVWKTDPSGLSVKAAEVRVSAGSMVKMAKRLLMGGRERRGQETALKRFRYLTGGVESLVKRLGERVRGAGGVIECGARVEEMICEGEGRWRVRHSRGETEANAVLSTIPVTQMTPMLRGIVGESAPEENLAALEYLAIHLVFLVINRPQATPNHWLYFPGEDICFNRGYEAKHFWEAEAAPADQTLLCLEITARPHTPLHTAGERELIERTQGDLSRIGLVTAGEIEKSFVVTLPFGYPLYDRLSDENLRRVLEHLAGWPGLIVTGRQGLFSHNNMDHSMHMGLEAARALAAGPEGVAGFYARADRLRHHRIVD
ncbi:FAD-dependent oxidoreductase [Candidatus Sumerlaeota bacterium]|nr:FAD-dependent oxidoreductase [Candidatus Sumerlaeota bacterium]